MRINVNDVVFIAIVLAGSGGAMTVANSTAVTPPVRQGLQVLVGVITLATIAGRLGLM